MAWTEKLPSGKHRGVYRDAHGKRRSAGAFSHKAAALRAAAAKETAVRRSLADDADAHKQPWSAWVDRWWPTRDVEASTLRTDKGRLDNQLTPRWGDVPIGSIRRNDVKAWAVELRRTGRQPRKISAKKAAAGGQPAKPKNPGLEPETVKRCVHLLSASLAAAVDEGIIDTNPAARLKLAGGEQAVEVYLEREEFEAILEQLPTFLDRLVASMLVYTGLRWGELAGLHRHRLDLEAGRLRVVETYDEKAGRIKAYPKGRRIRDVPLLPGLVDDLDRIFAAHAGDDTCQVPHATGRCRGPLAITAARGGVLRNTNWSDRVWQPAVEAAGVQHVRIHDLRHTFASWLLQGGRSLAEVGQLLGHVSPLTTQRYAHLARTADPGVLLALAGPSAGSVAPRLPHEADLENLDVRRSRRSTVVGPVGLEPTTSGLKARPGWSGEV